MDGKIRQGMGVQLVQRICLLFFFLFYSLIVHSDWITSSALKCEVDLNVVSEQKLLAAIAYGEASVLNDFEEMAAIANAVVRRKKAARMPSVNALVQRYKNFSYVVFNGNERYNQLMCATSKALYEKPYLAAHNALDDGFDYAYGGCFWDGYDLKTMGRKHMRYKKGFQFTDPRHNVIFAEEPSMIARIMNGKTYFYMFDSTAGYGKTVFWKLNQDYLSAAGAVQCL